MISTVTMTATALEYSDLHLIRVQSTSYPALRMLYETYKHPVAPALCEM